MRGSGRLVPSRNRTSQVGTPFRSGAPPSARTARDFVTASDDWKAKVSDARTGTPLYDLPGHIGAVRSIAFSRDRDGTLIVTASDDGTARVFDAATGQVQRVLEGHTGPLRRLGSKFRALARGTHATSVAVGKHFWGFNPFPC